MISTVWEEVPKKIPQKKSEQNYAAVSLEFVTKALTLLPSVYLNSTDFTPSRGTTPDHQRQSPFAGRISVDRSEPSLIEKKQRLLELLQEKQQYDDDSVADVGSEIENGAVHAEEYLKSSRKGAKANRASKSRGGCFPSSFWKIKFRSCRKKRKEQND